MNTCPWRNAMSEALNGAIGNLLLDGLLQIKSHSSHGGASISTPLEKHNTRGFEWVKRIDTLIELNAEMKNLTSSGR
ncbi:hypothetical protein V6N11_017462 [Hibiscus sabdariffa]|uniref:Uncharacterized protein n=1 Tax=Hibiscus sabdariffa TaxID=183260 RepID=A0ABR2TY36_9ROSI